MKTLNKKEARKLAKELNDILQPDPKISLNGTLDALQEAIQEGSFILAPIDLPKMSDDLIEVVEDIHGKKVKTVLQDNEKRMEEEDAGTSEPEAEEEPAGDTPPSKIIEEQKRKKEQEEEEAENDIQEAEVVDETDEEEEPVPDVDVQVKEAKTMKELKGIAKAYDEFKSIRSMLTKFKSGKELRLKMLEMLGVEPEEPVEEKPKEKKKETTPSIEKSKENPDIQVGIKVRFIPFGNKNKLYGTVSKVSTDTRSGKEYIQIEAKDGAKFHKRPSAIEIV